MLLRLFLYLVEVIQTLVHSEDEVFSWLVLVVFELIGDVVVEGPACLKFFRSAVDSATSDSIIFSILT